MTVEDHLQVQAALARSKGESPGRCELCGHIIRYGEKFGECPDTDTLECESCMEGADDE